ncbi:MAG TPA: hypothetical protein VGB60_08950 [Brevundimonas sp.]|uniref:hypothetical protein n=1 Tax=Brevundimonas sp. TaxID=1871086 RepID=UPI002ED9F1FB
MTLFRSLAIAGLFATSAQAQVPPLQPHGASAFDRHRYQADQHRYEMDRLRLQADQRDAVSAQIAVEAQMNRLRVQAARRPEPVQAQPYRALRSPEEERTLRLSAEERRVATTEGLGQIDAWLDRAPR